MKKKLIIAFLLFFPLSVSAQDKLEMKESKNRISLSGECIGENVRIDLFKGKEKDPAYTAGIPCKNGKFEFSDSFSNWPSFKEGEYAVAINGEKKDNTQVTFNKEDVGEEVAQQELSENKTTNNSEDNISPNESFNRAQNTFGENLASLQNSLLEMKIYLGEASFSKIEEKGMKMALDLIGSLVEKIGELFFNVEIRKTENVEKSAEELTSPANENTDNPVAQAENLDQTEENSTSSTINEENSSLPNQETGVSNEETP